MTTESEQTKPPKRKRLHRSTIVVALFLLLVGIIVNCGGNLRHDEGFTAPASINYGWPFEFAGWRLSRQENPPLQWTKYWQLNECSAIGTRPLMLNIAIWTLAILVISGLWELRRRHRNRLLSITLFDGLVAIALFAALAWWTTRLYDDVRREKVIADARWLRDVPADWFWQTLHVPDKYQPSRRTHVDLGSQFVYIKQKRLKIESLRETAQARHLRDLTIRGATLAPDAFKFDGWNNLTKLDISSINLSDDHIRSMPEMPRLESLSLSMTQISDDALSEKFAKLSNLKRLSLSLNTGLGGHTLGDFQNVEALDLSLVSYDQQTLEQIGKISKLKKLACTHGMLVNPIPKEAWNELAGLTNLETLVVISTECDDDNFGDEAMSAVASMPNLTSLTLHNSCLTDKGMEQLSKFRSLNRFEFWCDSNTSLTPASIAAMEDFVADRNPVEFRVTFPLKNQADKDRMRAIYRNDRDDSR